MVLKPLIESFPKPTLLSIRYRKLNKPIFKRIARGKIKPITRIKTRSKKISKLRIRKRFVRSRGYYLVHNDDVKVKRKNINRIPLLKERIQRSFRKSLYVGKHKTIKDKIKKSLKKSYFSRYLKKRTEIPFLRTHGFDQNLFPDGVEESRLLYKLRRGLKRYELNKMLNTPFMLNRKIYTPLSERSFYFGRVYLTLRRRNTFVTINTVNQQMFRYYHKTYEHVRYKVSCGLLGYAGPKRRTFHARMEVVKSAASFLGDNNFTSVDMIFPSGIKRFLRRFVRVLCESHLYVRYLICPKMKSHGFTRKKKLKRL